MIADPDSGASSRTDPLRRERTIILASLLLLAAAAWGVLVWQSRGPMQSGLTMGMQTSVVLLVWVVMMAAMMFPAAAPMVLLFALCWLLRASALVQSRIRPVRQQGDKRYGDRPRLAGRQWSGSPGQDPPSSLRRLESLG